MKDRLLHEISQELEQGRKASKDEGMDAYDLASEERDREISFILTGRDRGKLRAIEDALERVEDKSYGICESCESEIAEGRLEAMPFTRLCVQCQADHETEVRQNRREEHHTTRHFGGGPDIDDDNQ